MEKHKLLEDWNIIKEDFHNLSDSKLRPLREGEVWWTGIGENVGVEINGKSEYFSRPVLILKKFSRYVYSTSRLYSRMGQVPESDLEKVRAGFLALYSR